MQQYTAIIKKSGAWWIGWIEEIPGVNCQESTRRALLVSLRSALKESIEMNRQDALHLAEGDYTELKLAV